MASKMTLKCGCVVGETICYVCGCKCSESNICDGCKFDEDTEDECSSICKKCELPLYDMLFNYKPHTFCVC